MKKIGMCFLSLLLLCGCQQHSTKQKQVKQKDTIVLGYVNSDGYMKVKQKGKYGFMNKQKQVMIPCEYDLITQEKDVYIAQKDGKYGVIDKQNQILLPVEYERILYAYDSGYFFARKQEKTMVFDKDGQKHKTIDARLVKQSFHDPIVWMEQGNKSAIFDTKGNQKTKFLYDKIKRFPDIQTYAKHAYTIGYKNGLAAILNEEGKPCSAFVYEQLRPLNYGSFNDKFSGYYQAVRDGKSGIINTRGDVVVQFLYDACDKDADGNLFHAFDYIEGVGFQVVKDGHYGILTLQGKTLIPCVARVQKDASMKVIGTDEKGFWVDKEDTTAYFTKEGKAYLEVKGHGDGFQNGYAIVREAGLSRVINEKGETLKQGKAHDEMSRVGRLFQHCTHAVCTLYDMKGEKVLQGGVDESFVYLDGEPEGVLVKELPLTEGMHTTSTVYDLQGKKRTQFAGISSGSMYGVLYKNHFAFFTRQGYGKTGKMGLLSMDGKHEITPRYAAIGEQDDYYIGRYADGRSELIEKDTLAIILQMDKDVELSLT